MARLNFLVTASFLVVVFSNVQLALGSPNNVTTFSPDSTANITEDMLVNMLGNLSKLLQNGNGKNLTEWLLENEGNGTEHSPNFFQEWAKRFGNNNTDLRDILSPAALYMLSHHNASSSATSNPDIFPALSGIFNQQNSAGMEDLMSRLSPVLQRYGDQLMTAVLNGLNGLNISSVCSNHTSKILSAMKDGQMWAMQFVDAMGKPQSGLLEGALFWPGSFRECLNIVSPGTEDRFKGNYCMAKIPMPLTLLSSMTSASNGPTDPASLNAAQVWIYLNLMHVQYGLCVPSSCSTEDVGIMINEGFMKLVSKSLYNGHAPPVQPVCHTEEDITQDNRAVAVVCVLGVIGFCILLGTAYDVISLLLWQHKKCRKPENTKSNDVKLSQVVSNENGQVKMSVEEDVDIQDKTEDTAVEDSETGDEITTDPEVTSSEANNKPEMTSNGVSHMGAVDTNETKNGENEKRPKPGIVGGILIAFSLYTNAKILLNTDTKAGSLRALNGVRFLSMTWVVLCHTSVFHLAVVNNPLGYAQEFQKRWTSLVITNGVISVDSFFTISGLLVSYLTLKEMGKVKSAKINWFMFYFHRYWRLTPPYMLVIMTYVPLFQYWGEGPSWSPTQVEPEACNTYWWKNLIYINNFRQNESCLGHTWYLANDMQFYVISPLLLVPLFYSKIIGLTILACFFLATFITTGAISSINGLRPYDAKPVFLDQIYVKPWSRIGPYLVGVLVGYILFKTKGKVRLHRSTVLLGWCLATVVCLATLYGVYGEFNDYPLSKDASAAYNALHRTAWGAGIGWLLFACVTGYGGILNTFLSWKAFIPLARLTYMTYLIHPILMYYFVGTIQGSIRMSDIMVSYLFVGHLFFTYCLAFLTSMVFEAPFVGLEKVIFTRK